MNTYSNYPEVAGAVGVSDFMTDLENIGNDLWGGVTKTFDKIVDKAPEIVAGNVEKQLDATLSPANTTISVPVIPTVPTDAPAVNPAAGQTTTTPAPAASNDLLSYGENPLIAGGVGLGLAKAFGMSWLNSALIGGATALGLPYLVKQVR